MGLHLMRLISNKTANTFICMHEIIISISMAGQLTTLQGFANTFPRVRAIKTNAQNELNEFDYEWLD